MAANSSRASQASSAIMSRLRAVLPAMVQHLWRRLSALMRLQHRGSLQPLVSMDRLSDSAPVVREDGTFSDRNAVSLDRWAMFFSSLMASRRLNYTNVISAKRQRIFQVLRFSFH